MWQGLSVKSRSQPFCRTTGDRPCIPHIPPAGTNIIVGYSRARLKHCSLSTREEERETRTMSQEPQSQKGLACPIAISGNAHPPPGRDRQDRICHARAATIKALLCRVDCCLDSASYGGRGLNGDNLLSESIGLPLVPLMTPLLKYCSL